MRRAPRCRRRCPSTSSTTRTARCLPSAAARAISRLPLSASAASLAHTLCSSDSHAALCYRCPRTWREDTCPQPDNPTQNHAQAGRHCLSNHPPLVSGCCPWRCRPMPAVNCSAISRLPLPLPLAWRALSAHLSPAAAALLPLPPHYLSEKKLARRHFSASGSPWFGLLP